MQSLMIFEILWTQSTCLKSSNPHSKKVHKSNPSSYYSFIPFNHYDPYLWLSFLNIQPFAPTHISPAKKNPIPSKNPSLKNISWPVPLTSFGPRFKRKKRKQILLITHRRSIIPTKPTLIIITPSCHIFFIVVKLNNYLFFMKGLFVLQLHTH